MQRTLCTRLSSALVFTLLASAAPGGSAIEILALSGDPAPGGNGQIDFFSAPAINASGDIAVEVSLRDTAGGVADNDVLYLLRDGVFNELLREGDPAPANGGVFSVFSEPFSRSAPALNNAGDVALFARLRNTPGGTTDDSGLYLARTSGLTELIREGDPSPAPIADNFGDFTHPLWLSFAFNDNDHAAFIQDFDPDSFDRGTAVFRVSPTGVELLASNGAAAPGGGVFASLGSIGELGIIHLDENNRALVAGNTDGNLFGNGILRLEPGVATQIDSNAQGFQFASNAAGDVAYIQSFAGPNPSALMIGDGGAPSLVRAASSNDPDGIGPIESMTVYAISSSRQTLTAASIEASDSVFIDGTGPSRVVIRNGDPMPDANGTSIISSGSAFAWAFNNAGQSAALVLAEFTAGGASDTFAILFDDPSDGLTQIIRTGDTLLGRRVTDLLFQGSGPFAGVSRGSSSTGLNALGEVAFAFQLDDGRYGLARWSHAGGTAQADLDNSGVVDSSDLAIILAAWDTADALADLDASGLVDSSDLAIILAAWDK